MEIYRLLKLSSRWKYYFTFTQSRPPEVILGIICELGFVSHCFIQAKHQHLELKQSLPLLIKGTFMQIWKSPYIFVFM